ncbi:MAG: glycosyltransferase family 4 protein [Candidatus Bathyarchaeota archaeon]|jgi:glycosyltransferase involved in cell wall biosynthesis
MKVLMLAPFYSSVIGGTEKFIETISLQLNQMHVATDVLTFNMKRNSSAFNEEAIPVWEKEIQEINGIKVIKIPASVAIRPFKLFGVRIIPGNFMKYLKNYDILHFNPESDLSLPFFSWPIKKPKIMHCHCLDVSYIYYRKNVVSRTIFRKLFDIYIAVSKSIRDLLINLDVPEDRIRIVQNAVDTESLYPMQETKDTNLLLFVGRMDPKKGLHILLQSLEFIKTPIKLMIVGPLSNCDLEYNTRLFASIKKLNEKTAHTVKYLGVQEREELVKLYQKATIFVSPSFSEPFGIVNLEAMSCGTPVISTKVGGIPEVVKDGETGILVQSGNAKQLADAIQYILDNNKISRAFGNAGRKRVVQNYSQEKVANTIYNIYKELLTK